MQMAEILRIRARKPDKGSRNTQIVCRAWISLHETNWILSQQAEEARCVNFLLAREDAFENHFWR